MDERAYWTGVMMADGWIQAAERAGSHSRTVTLELAWEDRDHVQRFKDFLGCGHTIRKTTHVDKRTGVVSYGANLSQRDNDLAGDLEKLGVTSGKTNREVATPEMAMNFDFWNGYLDGDGCYATDPNIVVNVVGSEKLLWQFRSFAVSAIGMEPKAKPFQIAGTFGFNLNGRYAAAFCRYSIGHGGPVMPRKKSIAEFIASMQYL